MKRNMIVKSMLYAQDVLVYVEKYVKIMDKYYLDKNNNEKIDIYAMEKYVNFKEECEKGAKERGLI